MRMKLLPLMFSSLLFAGAAQAADLLQVYKEALENDAQYAAAKANLDAGREKLPQGRALLLPTIGLAANTMWNDVSLEGRTSPAMQANGRYNSNGYTLSLSQPLFRWQNWMQYDQSKFQVAQAEAQFVLARQDLILRVSQAYFDVLYAQENLRFLQAQKTAISQQLALAKKSFEVGAATVTDTHEAQSRYDLATAQEIAAESDLEVKRHALQSIISRAPGALASLRTPASLDTPKPARMDDWVSAAEKDNLNVQVQQAQAEIADREVGKQRAGHYPTVDLVATRGRASQTAFVNPIIGAVGPGFDQDTTTVGVQLNIPLFQGGAVVSKQREAEAGRESARAALEYTRRQAALGARQYFLWVINGLAQVRALEAAQVSSQSALDSNKLGYEVGVRINIDVLNAEQQLYSTQRDLAKARFDTLMAQLRLKGAVGSLADEDLQQINALLER
ncbi:MAG: TolC family outer membrane protein [Betaproteobacteria bacterium]|nr:TolC family outer membrane protein [Betaproteobacteria bacterium]